MPDNRWLTSLQAADRLGVKTSTLYAYVSRGMLTSHPSPGRRASRFDRAEVERLAGRPRAGGRPGSLELVVDSELTLIEPEGHLYYRGVDATWACRHRSYEWTAEWLWTGRSEEPPEWTASDAALRVGAAAQATLPPGTSPVDRMRVVAAAVGVTDPLRHDRRPGAVVATGRALVAALVDSLPNRSEPASLRLGGRRRDHSVAARLWPRLTDAPATPGRLRTLNAALVLMADHELAASTLAARAAASTWADPYLVVLAGLGAIGGPLHGGTSEATMSLLADVGDGVPTEEALGARLRSAGAVPGFGHPVYRGDDPRAVALLTLLRDSRPPAERWKPVERILAVMSSRPGPAPNVDFALAALAHTSSMATGSAEAIAALARCAGWIAHAIEEYPHRLRFRPRAAYVGPPPTGRPDAAGLSPP